MKYLKIIILCVLIISFSFNGVMVNVNATDNDFYWNEFDSGYVTFVVDDGKPSLSAIHDLFKKYDMPLSCAIVANSLDQSSDFYNPNLKSTLIDIENHGGEILSHTYNHNAFSINSTIEDVEYQFSNSYHILTNAGFNINGIIEAGSGGAEKKVDFSMVESVTRKYYKYSDNYGVSEQFKSVRVGVTDENLGTIKAQIIRAERNKTWLILMCHDFNELSVTGFDELLSFINKRDNVKMVTYRDMYENFGCYSENQDFGTTKYTVKYLDNNNNTLMESVFEKGSKVTPPKAPDGYKWDKEVTVADYNYTVKPVKIAKTSSKKDGNHLFLIVGAVAACAVGVATALTIIKKRKK